MYIEEYLFSHGYLPWKAANFMKGQAVLSLFPNQCLDGVRYTIGVGQVAFLLSSGLFS